MKNILPAVFVLGCAPEPFTIAVYVGGNGGYHVVNDHDQEVIALGGGSGFGELDANSHVQVTAIPGAGSQFVGFGGDCASAVNPVEFQMTRDMTCSVQFSD